jgi:LysR family transcriptional regulator, transcriptional activator of the cysJI operon
VENFRLKVFRAVARHLNFRMAAEELLLTQPAVSPQVKALESELDVALFDRAGGKVTLTAAGMALVPFAERLAGLASEAREAVAAVSGERAGVLAVGASQTVGQYLLPRLLAAFLAGHPKVEVRVSGGNTQTVLEALAEHRIGVALIEGPPMRQDVRVEPFMRDHLVCVVPAGHEWADEDVSLGQLGEAAFVTRELGSGSRHIAEQALEQAGVRVRDLHVRMSFDSTEGLLSAVEAGLGVAFVSRWAVRSQLALGVLRVAHVRELDLSRMFSVATTPGPEPAGITGAFRRFVLERAEALAPQATRKRQSAMSPK